MRSKLRGFPRAVCVCVCARACVCGVPPNPLDQPCAKPPASPGGCTRRACVRTCAWLPLRERRTWRSSCWCVRSMRTWGTAGWGAPSPTASCKVPPPPHTHTTTTTTTTTTQPARPGPALHLMIPGVSTAPQPNESCHGHPAQERGPPGLLAPSERSWSETLMAPLTVPPCCQCT